MSFRWCSRSFSVWLVALAVVLTGSTAPAVGQDVVRVHVSSLEGLVADAATATRNFHQPMTLDSVLRPMTRSFGLNGALWLDTTQPLALVMTEQGIRLGPRGLIGVFPVIDSEVALEHIGDGFEEHSTEDGVHAFSNGDEDLLIVMPSDGYLVLGKSRDLLTGVDLEKALNRGELPPGNIGIEVDLAAVRPMLDSWLKMREATASQQGADLSELEEQEGAMKSFLDEAVENISAVQIAFELMPEHAVFHMRLAPVTSSVLDDFIQAQTGGLPDVARLLETPRTGSIMVGQVTLTPAMIEAAEEQLRNFSETLQAGVDAAESDEAREALTPSLEGVRALAGPGIRCLRGDIVSTGEPSDAGKLSLTVAGIKDPDTCRELVTHAPGTLAGMQIVDEYLLLAEGDGAEEAMKRLVDRVETASSSPQADFPDFSPLKVGPGIFLLSRGDVPETLIDTLKVGAAQYLEGLSEVRSVYGARFGTDGMMLEAALPLTLFDSMGQIAGIAGGYLRPDGEAVPTSLTEAGSAMQSRILWQVGYEGVTGLATGDWDGDGTEDLLVATEDWVHVLNHLGTHLESIPVPSGMRSIELGLSQDRPRLLGYESWGPNVRVFDRDGTELWTYPTPTCINGAHWVDLDGDGNDEMILGTNAGGGLHAVSEDGQMLWASHRIANVWNQAAVVTEMTGPLVLATEAMGTVRIFDSVGEQLLALRPQKGYYSQMTATAIGADSIQILAITQEKVTAFNELGETFWQAPTSEPDGGWRGTSFSSGDLSGDGVPDWVFLNEEGDLSVATVRGERLATLDLDEQLVDHVVIPQRDGRGTLVTATHGTISGYRLHAEGDRVPSSLEVELTYCIDDESCAIALALDPQGAWAFGNGWGETTDDGLQIAMTRCANQKSHYGVGGECQPLVIAGQVRAEAYENLGPERSIVLASLAYSLARLDRHDSAVELLTSVLADEKRHGGEQILTLSVLASILKENGEYAEALESARKAQSVCQELYRGEQHCAMFSSNAAWIQMAMGDFAGALPQFEQVLSLTPVAGSPKWRVPAIRSHYGACLSQLGRYDEAEAQLTTAFEELEASLGSHHYRTRFAARRLVDLYDAWDRPEAAASYREYAAAPGLEPWQIHQ